MANLRLGIEDTHAKLIFNIKDQDNATVNLTTASSVAFVLRSGLINEKSKAMVIEDAANGQVSVQLNAGMLVAGIQPVAIEVTWNDATKSVTNQRFEIEGLQ